MIIIVVILLLLTIIIVLIIVSILVIVLVNIIVSTRSRARTRTTMKRKRTFSCHHTHDQHNMPHNNNKQLIKIIIRESMLFFKLTFSTFVLFQRFLFLSFFMFVSLRLSYFTVETIHVFFLLFSINQFIYFIYHSLAR